MASISVGSVSVDVVPSVRDFTKDLRAKIIPEAAKLGADIGKTLGEGITKGLGDPLSGPLEESSRKQREKAPRQGDDVAGSFASGFKKRLETAFKSLPKAKVDADSSPAERRIQELRAELAELSTRHIGVDIDAGLARTSLEGIKHELDSLGQNAPIHVRADTEATAAELGKLIAEVDRLDGKTARIKAEADTAKAAADLAATNAEADRLDGKKARVKAEAETAKAVADLKAAIVEADRLDGKNARVNVVANVAGALSGIFSVKSSLIGLGAATLPAIGAGIIGLAGPLAAAGVGFAGLAAVAVPALTRIKAAVAAQTQAQQQSVQIGIQVQQRALAMVGAQQALADAVRNEAFAHAQALQQVQMSEQQLAQSQISAAEAQRSLTQARIDAKRAIEDIKNQVIDAKFAIQDDQIAVDSAKLSYEAMAAAAVAAAGRVVAAQSALAAAQAAQNAVAADPAATDQAKAQAALNLTAAQLAVKNAQIAAKAADIQARQAKLAWQEGIQRLKEQQLQLQRLQQDEAKAAKAGVDGSNQVRLAREQLAQATLQVLNAERALSQARQNVARTDLQSSEQVAAARRGITAAVLSNAAANAQMAASMNALTPLERQAVGAWKGLTTAYQGWAKSLQPAVLPSLIGGIGLLKSSLPLLTPIVKGAGGAIGGLFAQAQTASKSPFWRQFSSFLGQQAGPAISQFGKLFGHLATSIAGLVQAFAPIGTVFLGVITQVAAKFSAFATGLVNNPAFKAFVDQFGKLAPLLLRTFTSLGGLLGSLFAAIAPLAGPALGVINALAMALGGALKAAAPAIGVMVTALGNGLVPLLTALGPVVADVVKGLAPFITGLINFLAPVLKAIVPLLDVLVNAIGGLLGVVAPFLAPLGKMIAALVSGLLPVLKPIIALYEKMAAQLAGQFLQALMQVMPSIMQIVQAFVSLLPALMPLIAMMPQLYMALIPLIPPLVKLIAQIVVFLVPILRFLIIVVVKIVGIFLALFIPVLKFLVNIMNIVVSALTVAIHFLATVFTWLYYNVVKPVFSLIGAAISWAWTNVIKPALAALTWYFNNVTVPVVKWLYNTIIKPIFTKIGEVFTWVWNTIIKPVLAAMTWYFNNVTVPLLRWLYNNIVKPIFALIGAAISYAWTNVIKPVFNAIGSALGMVGSAFSAGADAIKWAWQKVQQYTKDPINFVIDVVYNKGIVGLWNQVMSWLHLPSGLQLGKLPLLEAGGTLANPAQAGPMVTNGPMAIVGEGNKSYPEYVIPTDPKYRARAQGLWASAGGHLQMLAGGGILGGIGSIVKKVAGSVLNLGKDALSLLANPKGIWDKLTGPILGKAKGLATSPFGQAAAAVPTKILGEAWSAVKQIISTFSANFGGGGGAGALAMINLAKTQVGVSESPPGSNSQKFSHELGRPSEAWCFAAGTLVDTPDGLRPIEEVEPGSSVLTPTGNVAVTSALLTREKELLRLTALGVPDTLVTKDHPYWAMRRTTPAKHKRRLTEPEWIEAGELKRGDMIALPVPADGAEPYDADRAYALGMYLADGHRLHRASALGVQFSDAACERERVVTALKCAGFADTRVTENRTCLHFTVYGRSLYELCGQFGDQAHGKRIPGEVFTWNRAARQALLDGYLAGDGSFNETSGWNATTVSRSLAHGLGKLVRSLGFVPNVHRIRDAGSMTIEGRTVTTRAAYQITWKPRPIGRRQHFEADGYLWVPVRSLTPTGRVETVYDLTVPGEHAFIADGAAVHNCADFIDWLALKTGNSRIIPQTASAPGMAQGFGSAFQSGSSGIAPGDIVFYSGATNGWGGIGHVGIATTGGSTWQSVEGNSGDHVALNTRSSAQGHARPKYPVSGVGGSLIHASPAQAQAWAQQSLMGYGWGTAPQYNALIRLWNQESGWRWDALNPGSGAYGIPQSLPAAKMASTGADWHDNAATQMRWGLDYIKGRYGSPAGAWAHEQSYNWYDQGGILPTGPSLVYNGTGEPEAVFTGKQLNALMDGSSGGGTHYHAHFDGWTQASVQAETRTAFHTMEMSAANRERIGRRR